jgi:hypothetical protein
MTIWRMRIACWMPKVTDTHTEYVLFFHYNNGYANAPQCYVIRTLTVFFFRNKVIYEENDAVRAYRYLKRNGLKSLRQSCGT